MCGPLPNLALVPLNVLLILHVRMLHAAVLYSSEEGIIVGVPEAQAFITS